MTTTNETVNPLKNLIKIGLLLLVVVTAFVLYFECVGKNNDQNWQVVQSLGGEITVVDRGGYYNKAFGTVWTYPKYMHLEYTEVVSKEYPNDDSVTITFNDGGTAKASTVLRVQTPTLVEQRKNFHRQFAGNLDAIRSSVKAHLTNALKSTSPLMSSSEHQTARKSEYSQLVEEQLNQGLFEMRRVEKKLDQLDSSGKQVVVFATEVIIDEKTGRPLIAQPSPLKDVGITVTQFSVTETDYDAKTKEQFAVKKDAFLAAENSKAQREKEVQQRLMVVEKGLREKAEITAQANKELEAATIRANQEKLVAETLANQEKIVAETNAAKLVAVATQTKLEAETKAAQEKSVAETLAQQKLEVARLDRQAAEENAKKQIALAEAQKKSLELAGAISEKEKVLAEIARDRDIGVASQLSKIAVPSTIIGSNGAAGNAGNGDLNSQLMNVFLLKQMGVLKSQ